MRAHGEERLVARRAALVATTLAVVVVAGAEPQLPEGPGKEVLTKVCGSADQPERAAAVRLTREGWRKSSAT